MLDFILLTLLIAAATEAVVEGWFTAGPLQAFRTGMLFKPVPLGVGKDGNPVEDKSWATCPKCFAGPVSFCLTILALAAYAPWTCWWMVILIFPVAWQGSLAYHGLTRRLKTPEIYKAYDKMIAGG